MINIFDDAEFTLKWLYQISTHYNDQPGSTRSKSQTSGAR